MTSPRNHQQTVERIEEGLGTTSLIRKIRALGMPDPALDAALMQGAEELFEGGRKTECMEPEGLTLPQSGVRTHLPTERPKLYIF
jgi:hypothetical protein